MKKCLFRIFGAILACSLVTSNLPLNLYAGESAHTEEYEIYPTVQDITYKKSHIQKPVNVNLVLTDTLDEATKNHVLHVLSENNIIPSVSNIIRDGMFNVLVGTNTGENAVQTYAEENINYDANLFTKVDSYVLDISEKGITILGRDTDAAFFGVTTLQLILDQIVDEALRFTTIEDYSNTTLRGFIEGYYGVPWTFEDRKSLMEFGSRFKMNTYLFAPKDDPYHNSKWRDPYPAEDLARLAELTEVGIRTKNRFVWSIHPFMSNGVNFSDEKYASDLQIIIDKFETLYDVGVRQFGLLADDVWNVSAENQKRLAVDLNEWNKTKEGNYNLVFVPSDYNAAWAGNGSNLKILNTMPDEIHIMWTGDSVLGHITQPAIKKFQELLTSPEKEGRNPYFWLNWPVNDVNSKRLIMGPGEMLHTGVTDLDGVASNPMQQAEASKTSLFAVADFSWNTQNFDKDKSWADSFKYIDEDAGAELHIVSKHLQDPAPNSHGLVLPESEELKPKLASFESTYKSGGDFDAIALDLISEFEQIVRASEDFQVKTRNADLLDEIKPWLDSLRDQSQATIYYLKTAMLLKDANVNEVWENYSEGLALLEKSKTYTTLNINGPGKVEAGYKRLIPFITALNTDLSPKVQKLLQGGNEAAKPTVYTNYKENEVYQGTFPALIDGDNTTNVWFNRYIKVNDYVGLAFDTQTKIDSIVVLQGKNATDKDSFHEAVLEYSVDEVTWLPVNDVVYGPYENEISAQNLNITAKYVRLRATTVKGAADANPKWAAFREFSINKAGTPITFKPTIIKSDDFVGVYEGSEANIMDNNDSTDVWYKTKGDKVKAGGYIGYDLGKVIPLGEIRLLQGRDNSTDMLTSTYLEISQDGVNWEKVSDTFNDKKEIIVNLSSENKHARYIRFTAAKDTAKWTVFRELTVKTPTISRYVYTDQESLVQKKVQNGADSFSILPTTVTLESGKYIGIDLGRIRSLKSVTANLSDKTGLEVQAANHMLEIANLDDVDDARYVFIKNITEGSLTFDIEQFIVNTNEILPTNLVSNTLGTPENLMAAFDGKLTTNVWFKTNQNKGNAVVYDLGQYMDLEHIKMYLHDSEVDFIRNGKISVSSDNEVFHDVLLIGDGSASGDVTIGDVYPNHEISYMTIENEGFNHLTRYIKLEITKTLDVSKWVRFAEIELNHGQPLEKEINPTYKTEPKAKHGFGPENMFDNDFQTAFTSSAEGVAGHVSYILSDNTVKNQIKILQSKNTISNALVSVRTSQNEWIELGKLSQGFTEFILNKNMPIFEIKISWTAADIAPVIYEIFMNEIALENLDFTALVAKKLEIAGLVGENYAGDAWNTLQEMVVTADLLETEITTTQVKIDAMVASLTDLESKLVSIVDLRAAITKATAIDKELYTTETVSTLEMALETAEVVLADTAATQVMVDAAIVSLEMAVGNLEEKGIVVDKTVLDAKVAEAKLLDTTLYTDASIAELEVALETAEAVLADTAATQAIVDAAIVSLETAINNLEEKDVEVDKSVLDAKVAEAKLLDTTIYTIETVTALEIVITDAELLLVDALATQETVNAAITALEVAISGLIQKPEIPVDTAALSTLIAFAQDISANLYTPQTYTLLQENIVSAVAILGETTSTQEMVNAARVALEAAINNLVARADTSALTQLVIEAEAIDLSTYTAESIAVFEAAIISANTVISNLDASIADVDAALSALQTAIEGLTVNVTTPPVFTYNKAIKLLATQDTTEETFIAALAIGTDVPYTITTNFMEVVNLQEVGNYEVHIEITYDTLTRVLGTVTDTISVETYNNEESGTVTPPPTPGGETNSKDDQNKLPATGSNNATEILGGLFIMLGISFLVIRRKMSVSQE